MGKIILNITEEMKNHAPFTIFGALTGIIIMSPIFYNYHMRLNHLLLKLSGQFYYTI